MKVRVVGLALFLAIVPTALASTAWYVDGVNGNDSNDCKTRTTACKTIGHAISLASSGDTIRIGPATYTENLTISISLTIIGAGAATTIIEGGSTVVTISSTNSHVALSKVSILNGSASQGGGIFNAGTLEMNSTTISGNAANHGLPLPAPASTTPAS